MGSPQQTGAEAENSSGGDDEGFGTRMDIENPTWRLIAQKKVRMLNSVQKARNVKAITTNELDMKLSAETNTLLPQGAKLQCESGTEHIVHRTADL